MGSSSAVRGYAARPHWPWIGATGRRVVRRPRRDGLPTVVLRDLTGHAADPADRARPARPPPRTRSGAGGCRCDRRAGCSGVCRATTRRSVTESEVWTRSTKSRNPVREVLFGSARREFVQVFVLMSGSGSPRTWPGTAGRARCRPGPRVRHGGHRRPGDVQAVPLGAVPLPGALRRTDRPAGASWPGAGWYRGACAAAFGTISAGWWTGFGPCCC